MPSINWGSAIDGADQSSEYEILPAAEYIFELTAGEVRTSSTGKTMFTMSAQVQDGPHRGRVLRHNFVLSPESPKAMGIFLQEMGALGLNVAYFRSEPEDEQVVRDLTGRKFRGRVRHRQYNGTDRAEISRFAPMPTSSVGVPPPPPPADQESVVIPASTSTPEGMPF
jgi:hypothetical protein